MQTPEKVRLPVMAGRAVIAVDSPLENSMADKVLARIAALKSAPLRDLQAQWRGLFDSDPPRYNRRHLEARLAYRIQELAYGGLKPETVERLERLGEEIDGRKGGRGRHRLQNMPVAGTRLVREWKGVEHTVTVLRDGFEWEGRPYKSLSAIARAIAGTRWNGRVFFGLRAGGAPE